MPIKPKPGNDIIKHEGGDGNHQSCTTYQGHYVAWKGVLPAKTVQIKQLYVPNAGEMDFQSIQRLHFRGTYYSIYGQDIDTAHFLKLVYIHLRSNDVHSTV